MLPHVRGWQKIPTMFNIFANCLKANLICECFVYCLKLVLIFLQWTSVLQARAISTATTAIRAWAATHVGTASPHVSLRVMFCFIRRRHTPFNYSLKPYHHCWHKWNRIAHNEHLSLHRHLKGDITPSIENNLSDKRTYDKQLSQADKVKNLNPNERFKLWCYFICVNEVLMVCHAIQHLLSGLNCCQNIPQKHFLEVQWCDMTFVFDLSKV